MRRTVPWISWEEWWQVKSWLLSSDRAAVIQGVNRVAAWRVRGRVPLGVDITASLLETALQDPQQSCVLFPDSTSSSLPHHGSMSQQLLRLQYSLTLVRMVNGIADSQQRGKVAVSVASLADAAGLPRLLVDLRHDATHNELPALPTLHVALHQALGWLTANYWQRQTDHCEACWGRISTMLAALAASCTAAAAKNRRGKRQREAEEEDEEEEWEEEAGEAQGGYQGAEGKKERRLLLAELRGLVPPTSASLLVDAVLAGTALTAPSPATAPSDRASQQQQRLGAADSELAEDGAGADTATSATATRTALRALERQYPQLPGLLLHGAVQRLAGLLATPAPQAASALLLSAQDSPELPVSAAQGQRPAAGGEAGAEQQGRQMLGWVDLLLAGWGPGGGGGGAPSSAAAARPKKKQKQAVEPAQQPAAGTGFTPQQLLHLQHMLLSIHQAAADEGYAAMSHLNGSSSSSGDGTVSWQQEVLAEALHRLQHAAAALPQQVQQPAVAKQHVGARGKEQGQGTAGRIEEQQPQENLLLQLLQLAAPAVQSAPAAGTSSAAAAAPPVGSNAIRALQAAQQQQEQLLQRLQVTRSTQGPCALGASPGGGAARHAVPDAAAGGGVWSKVSTWYACPVGTLPSAHSSAGRIPCLDLVAAGTATAAAGGGGCSEHGAVEQHQLPQLQGQAQQQQQQQQHQQQQGQQPPQAPDVPLTQGRGADTPPGPLMAQLDWQQPPPSVADPDLQAEDSAEQAAGGHMHVMLGCWRVALDQLPALRAAVRVLL